MHEFKVGSPVYVVVRMGKYTVVIHQGMVIGCDEENISYALDGTVKFSPRDMAFGTLKGAEGKRAEIERESVAG